MPKSINDWLAEGEQLYTEATSQMHDLEQQLAELEQALSAKQAEVNRIAQVIGKPAVEGRKVVTAQIVGQPNGENGHIHNQIPNSPATIARALTGRGLGR